MVEDSELLTGFMSPCVSRLLNTSSEVADALCKALWSLGRKNECE